MDLHTAASSAKPRPKHILIVDDEAVIRDMMVDILDLEGFEVIVARNGREALTRLREATPDEGFLIFLDLMMPIMDGYDLCYAIHADKILRQLHTVVIMSALDQLARATSLHADATMPKPFDVEDIMNIIHLYME
jgi:CheY-like chemotaxis protein